MRDRKRPPREVLAVEWHERGERCLLLKAFVGLEGWRIVIPPVHDDHVLNVVEFGFCFANEPDPETVVLDGDPGHRWARWRRRGRVWHLNRDFTTWPLLEKWVPGTSPVTGDGCVTDAGVHHDFAAQGWTHYVVNCDGSVRPLLAVTPQCSHREFGLRSSELLADVREFERTSRTVRRTLH